MTETGPDMITSRWVVRRTVYLLIGGAVALAFLMLGSVLASPAQGDTISDLRPPAIVALTLMIGVGLLPGVREVQVAAAQTLLGATDVTVPVPMRWSHRWRTAVWTFVHQAVGFAVGIALALAALAVSGTIAFVGGQDYIDVLRRIDRPDTTGEWVLLYGGACASVLAAVIVVIGGGLSARWAAPLLLGASGDDRLVAAERRLRREQEYGRLSRDLHDGVGHALSAISLQAAAGERVVRRDPDRAADALSSIQALAADAVGELDQVLGMLRGRLAPTQPEPGVDDIPALAERHRELGLDVDLTIEPGPRIPGPLSRLTYRVCAEAMSNAAKHAGPGPVTMVISVDAGALDVHVVNRTGARPAEPRRSGHGLAALAETVAVFGGTLDAGPDGDRWILDVRVPMGGIRGRD